MEVKRFFDHHGLFATTRSRALHLQKEREILEPSVYTGYMNAPRIGTALALG
jgi:hypothetical protein